MKWMMLIALLFQASAYAAFDEGSSFTKPPGPPEGGTIKVPHPDAAKGLMKIKKDGSYQYRVPKTKKTQSMSVKIGVADPPDITNSTTGMTYSRMYGKDKVYSLLLDYEWTPFRAFGALGLNFGAGLAMSRGNGTLADGQQSAAQETYSLYMIPLTLGVVYRMEYWREQWIVPFAVGGYSYTGLVEVQDGGGGAKYVGASSVGGGGGLHISITRMDPEATFSLRRDYGVSDMWLTLEVRMMKGLASNRDFTSALYNAGVTVDF